MASFGSRLVELLPHYLAMVAAMFAVLFAIQELYGDIGFWASFAVAILIAGGYPFAARRLGIAPGAWQR
ncbi:hypothetical protein HAPAU_09150 [Halalkalicoccus paucihalophilus]|uniref:Uncharacterized protein n=1 Tax=Halalkalicoccus paucihalophilus TaxID=1008153 RepID=A0A151AHA0_9EURY|nr:hypothetical protein [Halalkalicoccus paucihalophilus]KYH27026.1 hypothetical protein HAPAU_09150 [Halalkalicoccus paucihalophilus]